MRVWIMTAILAGTAATASAQSAPVNPPSDGKATMQEQTGTPVIQPGNPDPKMAVKPPAAGITPVLPPPGSAGSGQPVTPK